MAKENQKRKHDRIGSLNLLNYVCLDENNEEVVQGMGRTLNVSQGGILIESHIPIDKRYIVSLSIGLENEMVDIKGKVVYYRDGKEGKFESGIQFKGINEKALKTLNRYIIAFRELQEKG